MTKLFFSFYMTCMSLSHMSDKRISIIALYSGIINDIYKFKCLPDKLSNHKGKGKYIIGREGVIIGDLITELGGVGMGNYYLYEGLLADISLHGFEHLLHSVSVVWWGLLNKLDQWTHDVVSTVVATLQRWLLIIIRWLKKNYTFISNYFKFLQFYPLTVIYSRTLLKTYFLHRIDSISMFLFHFRV